MSSLNTRERLEHVIARTVYEYMHGGEAPSWADEMTYQRFIEQGQQAIIDERRRYITVALMLTSRNIEELLARTKCIRAHRRLLSPEELERLGYDTPQTP